MNTHHTLHTYEVRALVKSTGHKFDITITSTSAMSALYDFHVLMQRKHMYGPRDYTVTAMKRANLSAYDMPPGAKNPDVRQKITPAAVEQAEEGLFASMDFGGPGIPIASLPFDTPATSSDAQL